MMSDAVPLTLLWLAVLGAGLGACVLLARWGVPRTHVRDLLHVGAGSWVLGWPWWPGPTAPIAITLVAFIGGVLVPVLASRVRALEKLRSAVAGADEQWSGIVLYVLSFGVFTAVGLWRSPFPAAAALLALALGDGIGGAVGLRFGRTRYRVPWAKPKSVEGTLAVAVMSAVGIAVASRWFDAPVALPVLLGASVIAAVFEALSPRASDNLLLPASVWTVLVLAG